METPSGKTEPGEIVESTKDTYTIRFVTKEGGIYKVCMQLFAIIGCIAVWRNSQGGTRCIVFLGPNKVYFDVGRLQVSTFKFTCSCQHVYLQFSNIFLNCEHLKCIFRLQSPRKFLPF